MIFIKEKLLNRIEREYADFKSKMISKERNYIFDNSYEISFKSQIYDAVDNSEISNDVIKYLLKVPNSLECLYDIWLRAEISTIADMTELFSSKIINEYIL